MKDEKTKYFVVQAMKEDMINRNSDKWLVFNVLKAMGFTIRFNSDEIAEMPSFETITRIRREIQNSEGRLLADEEIDEQREIRREELEEKYGLGNRETRGINGVFNNFRSKNGI